MAARLIDDEQAEQDLIHCAARLAETIDGQDGYTEAMSAIALQFTRNGEFDLGVRLVDSIEDPYARDQILAEVAVICADAGDHDYAVELIASLDEYSFQTLAKGNIAVAEAEKGNVERAREFAHQLDDPSGTFAEIAIRLAKQDRFAEAIEAAEDAEFEGSRAWAYTEIGARYLETGQPAEALAMLDRALAEADELSLPEDRISMWMDIVIPLIRAGEKERVEELLNRAEEEAGEIESESLRDPALARVIDANARSGRFDRAEELTETIEDPLQAVAAMLTVAGHLQTAEQNERALAAVEEALKLATETDVWEERSMTDKESLLSGIAARYFELGHQEQALAAAQQIQSETIQANTFFDLANRHVVRGEAEPAIATVTLIPDEYTRAVCWLALSRGLAEADSEQSAAVLERARAAAPGLKLPFQRADLYARLAQQVTDPDESRRLLTKAVETVPEIPGARQRALTLLALSIRYADTELTLNASELDLLHNLVVTLKD